MTSFFVKIIFIFILFILSPFTVSSVYATTYTVTKTADTNDGTCDADCSLREALAAANANSGSDTIAFSIPTSDGGYTSSSDDWTITLGSALSISSNQSVTFDGTTQTGTTGMPTYGGKIILLTSSNVQTITCASGGSGSDVTINHITFKNTSSTPQIMINGQLGNGSFAALSIQNSYFTRDVRISSTNNAVSSNVTGNTTFSNNKIDIWTRGPAITSTSSSVTITYDSNVLTSPTSIGLRATGYNISVTNNTITGNSDQGVLVSCTGGTCTTSNNTLTSSSSGDFGSMVLSGAGSFLVTNNTINTGNTMAISITSTATITGNTINGGSGSTTTGKIHVNTNDTSKTINIRNNTISVSNAIPIYITGANTRAQIQNNAISTSWTYTPLNINDGQQDAAFVTANDPGDVDGGVNNTMNFPIITSARYLGGGEYQIDGNLDRNLSEGGFVIEVCESDSHSSGHGGCLRSLGTTNEVGTTGAWFMKVKISGDDGSQTRTFSALATNNNGSTSEFGPNVSYTPVTQTKVLDITALGTTIVDRQNVIAIVENPVIPFDAYLDITKIDKQAPGIFFVSNGITYWQVSPLYEIWWRSYFNDAKILSQLFTGPHIFALHYQKDQLGILSERFIKLAYSTDSKTWRLLPSVLDLTNKTVATMTKPGGYYMLITHN